MKLLGSDCLQRSTYSDLVGFTLFSLNWFVLCLLLHSVAFYVACTAGEKWNFGFFSKGCPTDQVCAQALRTKSLAFGFRLSCYLFNFRFISLTPTTKCCVNFCNGSLHI